MPSSFTPINLLDLIKGATSKTSDTDPFMSYHPVDLMRDVNAGHYFANFDEVWDHSDFPDRFRDAWRAQYPDLAGRSDRNMEDIATNFAGGYDWAVRPDVDVEKAQEMAKAYQGADYYKGVANEYMPSLFPTWAGQVDDSIGDYNENLEGIDAAIPDRGNRISMEDLVKKSYEYAKRKRGLLDGL